MSERLEYLARRAADDPFYLAAPLATYARSEGLDDGALAAHLGCARETLTLLRLCRRPRGATFAADAARIAGRFALDPLALAEIVRRADALAALCEGAGAEEKGTLMAARDRLSPLAPLPWGEGRSAADPRASYEYQPPPTTEERATARESEAGIEEEPAAGQDEEEREE